MIRELATMVADKVKPHAPLILLIAGTVGVVSTAVVAARQSSKIADAYGKGLEEAEEGDSMPVKAAKVARRVAPAVAPVVAVGAGTLACFYGADRIRVLRMDALANAYSLLSSTANSYMEKVEERLTEKDKADVRRDILEDIEMPECDYEAEGTGDTLVYDKVTGRYFKSTIVKIKEAEAEVAKRLNDECIVPLNYFYEVMGLDDCSVIGEAIGWAIDGVQLNLAYRSMLDERNRPCLVLVYRTMVIDRMALGH